MLPQRVWRTVREWRQMPRVTIDLMLHRAAANHAFYADLVRRYHADAYRRHPKYLVIRRMTAGVAVCPLPARFDDYFMAIDGSARRNYKKAVREGLVVRRIDFNAHLEGIRDIRRSTAVRQGRAVPDSYLSAEVSPCTDPVSTDPTHDYPYFGAFLGDQLLGYAGCMVAGEACCLEQILGHAAHLSTGAVPQLMIEIARHVGQHHPQVRYYVYDTYFGAGDTLRRFKRKFNFLPHRVTWVLGERPAAGTDSRPEGVA